MPPEAPSPPVPPAAAELRHSVLRLSRRLLRQGLHGLSPSRISVMTTLERRGEMLVGELTRVEQLSKSSITRIVAGLEDLGYVSRRISPEDKRGVILALTDQGREVLRQAGERQDSYLSRQMGRLEAEDRRRLEQAIPVLEALLEIRA